MQQPTMEGSRASHTWRQEHSSSSNDDKCLFAAGTSESNGMYLAMSIGSDGTRPRNNDSAEPTPTTLTTTPTVATNFNRNVGGTPEKLTMTTPTLLDMLKDVPAPDKAGVNGNRRSPTSVTTVDLSDHGNKSKPDFISQNSGSISSSGGESWIDISGTAATRSERNDGADDGTEDTDEDDDEEDGTDAIELNTSSTRKLRQIAALELALEQAQAQRVKMVANIQKKKQLLADSQLKLKALQQENVEIKKTSTKLSHENASLHCGLAKVTASRDELRNKLRIKQDVLRETRAEKDDTEKKLKRSEQGRILEQELLANYRRLAIHTGYFKWGKEIRMLEAALEKANAEQQE